MLLGGARSRVPLHRVLPPQLEELQVERQLRGEAVGEDDLEVLVELAARKRVCVPGLKRLVWWVRGAGGGDGEGRRVALYWSTIEMGVGVRFEVVGGEVFGGTRVGKRVCEW